MTKNEIIQKIKFIIVNRSLSNIFVGEPLFLSINTICKYLRIPKTTKTDVDIDIHYLVLFPD